MAEQTQTQILNNIFGVLNKINSKLDNKNSNTSNTNPIGNITGNFDKLNKGVNNAAKSLGNITNALMDFTKIKTISFSLNLTTKSINKLFTVFEKYGDPTSAKKINKSILLLKGIGNSLMKIAKPLTIISSSLIIFGTGILVFTGSLFLMSTLFGVGNIMLGIGAMLAVFVNIILIFKLLSLSTKYVKDGAKTLSKIGTSMLDFSLSLVALGLTMKLFSLIFNVSSITEGLIETTLIFGSIVFIYKILGSSKIKQSVKDGSKTLSKMGKSMMWFSLGLVSVALTLRLIPEIVGAPDIIKGGIFLTSIFLGFTFMMLILGNANKYIEPGVQSLEKMGKSMMWFSLGLVSVALTLRLIPEILSGMSVDDRFTGIMTIVGVMAGFGAFMYLLGKWDDKIGKGVTTLTKMSTGIMLFSLSILSVAIVARLSAEILYDNSKGIEAGVTGVFGKLGLFGVMAAEMIGLIYLIGKSEKEIKKGSGLMMLMSVGIILLSISIYSVALSAKKTADLLFSKTPGLTDSEGKEKDNTGWGAAFRKLGLFGVILGAFAGIYAILGAPGVNLWMLEGIGVGAAMAIGTMLLAKSVYDVAKVSTDIEGLVGNQKNTKFSLFGLSLSVPSGLAAMARILAGSAALFAALGIPGLNAVILMGSGVAMGMAKAMTDISGSILTMMNVSKQIDIKAVNSTVTDMIKGMIDGFESGFEGIFPNLLSTFVPGLFNTKYKIIQQSTDLLSYMSISVASMANALIAFAEVGNFYDLSLDGTDKNGRRTYKKGQKVNIQDVVSNISLSIKTFLKTFIDLGDELKDFNTTKLMDIATLLMGSSASFSFGWGLFTGKKVPGLLEPIIKFAEVLKTFAKSGGASGSLAVQTFDTKTGKKVMTTVKTVDVAKNIGSAFMAFAKALGDGADDLKMDNNEKLKEFAAVLMGSSYIHAFGMDFGREEPGILDPIVKFADVLKVFADTEFDPKGNIQLPLFKDGKPTGKYISASEIGTNIMNSLNGFVNGIANEKTVKNISDAESNIGKFGDLMDKLKNVSETMDPLIKFTDTLGKLAEHIGLLAENLTKLNTDKLNGVIKSTKQYDEIKEKDYSNYSPNSQNSQNLPNNTETNVDWDIVSAQIGESVGTQIVTAMKQGQVKFEFSPTNPNKGVLEFD